MLRNSGLTPNIFRDMGLRHTLRDLGVDLDKGSVALLGRVRDEGMPAALQIGEIVLQQQAEEAFEFRDPGAAARFCCGNPAVAIPRLPALR